MVTQKTELTWEQVQRRVLIVGNPNHDYTTPKMHDGKIIAYVHTFDLDENWVCLHSAIHDGNDFQAAHRTEQLLTGIYPNLVALLDGISTEFGPEYEPKIPDANN